MQFNHTSVLGISAVPTFRSSMTVCLLCVLTPGVLRVLSASFTCKCLQILPSHPLQSLSTDKYEIHVIALTNHTYQPSYPQRSLQKFL